MSNQLSTGKSLLQHLEIGRTPLMRLDLPLTKGEVLIKAEFRNPFGSVKDRTAAYLMEHARRVHGNDIHIVESTSGNLGISLSQIGQLLGNEVTLVMDVSVPAERMAAVEQAGGMVVVVREPLAECDLRETRIRRAHELGTERGKFWVDQYSNLAGMMAHAETTGPEIWEQAGGRVDTVVASVGTGGTICGIGLFMKWVSPSTLIIGVEPTGSTIFGGVDGPYRPAGAGFHGRPEIVTRMMRVIDLCTKIPDHVAASFARLVHKTSGITIGLTAGAAVAVAVHLAEDRALRVVAIAADSGRGFESDIEHLAEECDQIAVQPEIELVSPALLAQSRDACQALDNGPFQR